MTRLIDADALFEKYQKWLEETPYTDQTDVQLGQRIVLCDIYHDLKYAPTIDAVEVVRCKECRKRKYCEGIYYDFNEMNYCAHGERETK